MVVFQNSSLKGASTRVHGCGFQAETNPGGFRMQPSRQWAPLLSDAVPSVLPSQGRLTLIDSTFVKLVRQTQTFTEQDKRRRHHSKCLLSLSPWAQRALPVGMGKQVAVQGHLARRLPRYHPGGGVGGRV